jgi:hypothetical protein
MRGHLYRLQRQMPGRTIQGRFHFLFEPVEHQAARNQSLGLLGRWDHYCPERDLLTGSNIHAI